MTDATSDLDVLFPGEDVRARGETVKVEPFYSTQFGPAAKLARPLMLTLLGSGLMSFSKTTNADGSDGVQMNLAPNWPIVLLEVAEDGFDQLIRFTAFAIGKEFHWFDKVRGDELIDLALAVFKQNSDFFTLRIQPKLQAWMPAAPAAAAPAAETGGEPSSRSSSDTGTAEPKSTE
jgi:hypothetical protein